MTPAARIAAAIEILDRVLAGEPAERMLTNWARASRFAGSGDRAAVRDHVYDGLRQRQSAGRMGGAPAGALPTGRQIMLGLVRAGGGGIDALFTGHGHAPPPPDAAERAALDAAPAADDLPEADALDCPAWLLPDLRASLGADFAPVMQALRQRAPVFLRVNLPRTGREAAIAALAAEGIAARPHPLADTALEVTGGAARIRASSAYREGLVELQDASSQAAVAFLGVADGERVIDYCAGGGGKALAMAAAARARVFAHDADPARMADLPARAARAGARIGLLDAGGIAGTAPFDLVVVDAPCSGSGTWRRTPDMKWRLDPARLAALVALQGRILAEAAPLVRTGGRLAYMTCSLLAAENEEQVDRFLAGNTAFREGGRRRWLPTSGGDGFFASVLTCGGAPANRNPGRGRGP